MGPDPSPWVFPDPTDAPDDLLAVGADLSPETLEAAYRAGYFPMPIDRSTIGWFSPRPRGVIPLADFRPSRSLRRSVRRYEITIDLAFRQVMIECADPHRPHGWITPEFVEAYSLLHSRGHAHSVECWEGDRLVGGLYGVGFGGFFAGESMFHRATDASKVALTGLVDVLRRVPALLDVQWATPHLATLGAVEWDRATYLSALRRATQEPSPWAHLTPGSLTPQLATLADGRSDADGPEQERSPS